MNAELVVILTGVLVAAACALIGSFLVLRKMAMMADAISHAVLPGLVAAYFLARGPNLLAGFLGATAAGMLTVTLVELLYRSGKVKEDSAIGIVFPGMFALGTLLVSRYFANVHLDADAVLYGEIAFAPFEPLIVAFGGARYDLGPQSLWVMGGLLVLNLAFVLLLYKELKLATFDPGLAAALGFSPALIHYLLMLMVSLTTVGAFAAVGAILVIALLIVPAATAYLLTDRLPRLIGLAVLAGALSAVGGYYLAVAIDASIAGAMATVAGALFLAALMAAPRHGLVARALRLRRQRHEFAASLLLVHLLHHEADPEEGHESALPTLAEHMHWAPRFTGRVVALLTRRGLAHEAGGNLVLTPSGRSEAQATLSR
jgi:manganese/zinc/iron transport system permease protein